jgi:Rhodopirellula transposase DDE domain
VKSTACGSNEQFENIESLKQEYFAQGNPVISMDSKKAKRNLYREASIYTTSVIKVFDHDFPSLARGVAISHGLYDLKDNTGFIQIGTSHDTSEFACDSIRYWWNNYGKNRYELDT